ncbi:MAG: phytase [Richelia sp. RM2_1_2]|nr:phytase [Richelia sp. SM2_1_7]NJM21633.1 phytase [Richelia sp. SM1_7_0]NJN12256.1 phytase [Richelia sp. RM1_1_1]NJO63278.1 phytase [Richelia sp. RM2_1_2]
MTVEVRNVGSNGKLMPDGVGLNINIPAVVDNIEGVSYTKLDGTGTFNLFVGELAPNVPRLLFSPETPLEPSEIKVNANLVRTLELPIPTGDAEDSQSEGIVIDQELGFLYVSLENEVGILKFSAEPDGGDRDFNDIEININFTV